MVVTRKIPTIQDVARHANVSAATVSRVLSAPERVSETTRQRVEEAVRATGYTINQAARSLRMRTARTILLASPDVGNPFYSTIVEAVIRTASQHGYSVLVASRLGDDPNRWLSDYLNSNRADGLLLFDGSLDTSRLHDIGGAQGLPLVAAYDEPPDPEVHSVLTDNREAARRVVKFLHGLGHKRIGHVSGLSRNQSTNERLVGFETEMRALGLEIRPEWVVPGIYNMESGLAAVRKMVASGSMPTAIFAGNDEMAIGVIRGLREAGLTCPGDVSVVGFDDIPVASYFDPAITTMHQPREAIGRIATEALIEIIEGDVSEDRPRHVILKSELVIRDSTARIA